MKGYDARQSSYLVKPVIKFKKGKKNNEENLIEYFSNTQNFIKKKKIGKHF